MVSFFKINNVIPVKTGISIGTVAVYGLFNLTPKLRSPLKRSNINTPMCIKPTRAKIEIKFI